MLPVFSDPGNSPWGKSPRPSSLLALPSDWALSLPELPDSDDELGDWLEDELEAGLDEELLGLD